MIESRARERNDEISADHLPRNPNFEGVFLMARRATTLRPEPVAVE